jgi:hypothetical protein
MEAPVFYASSDAQGDPGREDYRDRLAAGVCGGLVGVGAVPRLDSGAIAIHGRQAGVLRGIERGEHRRRAGSVIRPDSRLCRAIIPLHARLAMGERRSRRSPIAHLDSGA